MTAAEADVNVKEFRINIEQADQGSTCTAKFTADPNHPATDIGSIDENGNITIDDVSDEIKLSFRLKDGAFSGYVFAVDVPDIPDSFDPGQGSAEFTDQETEDDGRTLKVIDKNDVSTTTAYAYTLTVYKKDSSGVIDKDDCQVIDPALTNKR